MKSLSLLASLFLAALVPGIAGASPRAHRGELRSAQQAEAPAPPYFAPARRWLAQQERHPPRQPVDTMEAAVVLGPESANAPLLPPGSFRRVVRRNLGQLAHCFEQGRTQNPELHGQVLLHVVVQPDGAVASASVAGTTLPLPTVAQCLAGSFRRWQFPAPRGAQPVFLAVPLVLLQFEVRVRRGWRNGPYGSTYGPL